MKSPTIQARIGRVAIAHPETWVMSWAMAGIIIAAVVYSGIGWWIGHFANQGLLGAWCGMGFYGYWLAQHLENINASMDVTVASLKELR